MLNEINLQGPCTGDSGGPLYVDHGYGNRKQITIEGIVSGGVGACGSNQARLYTRVSAHKEWIDCVVEGINENMPKEDIEAECLPMDDEGWMIRQDDIFGDKKEEDDIYGQEEIFSTLFK